MYHRILDDKIADSAMCKVVHLWRKVSRCERDSGIGITSDPQIPT